MCLTLTRSSGNCPREFSGTLIGGMTQSLFTRLRVPSPLTTTLRHGNKISGTRWVSVASLGFTCRDSKQALCTGLHTHTHTHAHTHTSKHTQHGWVAEPACWEGLVTQGISDLIPVAWINAIIIVPLINDHHLSPHLCVCVRACVGPMQPQICMTGQWAATLQGPQRMISKRTSFSFSLCSHNSPAAHRELSPWPWVFSASLMQVLWIYRTRWKNTYKRRTIKRCESL